MEKKEMKTDNQQVTNSEQSSELDVVVRDGRAISGKQNAPILRDTDILANPNYTIDGAEAAKKAALTPMGPMAEASDIEKSPWVGKAVGMNLLIGIAGFFLAKFLGCGFMSSMGWGMAGFTMGQEIRSMWNTSGEMLTGKRGLFDGRSLSTWLPLVAALGVSVFKKNPNWTMGSLIVSTVLSKAANTYLLNSDTYYRYYQKDREAIHPELKEKREQVERERGVRKGYASSVDIVDKRVDSKNLSEEQKNWTEQKTPENQITSKEDPAIVEAQQKAKSQSVPQSAVATGKGIGR